MGPKTYLLLVSGLQKTWKRHLNQIIDHTFGAKGNIESESELIEDTDRNICTASSSNSNKDETVNIVSSNDRLQLKI